MPVSKPRPPGTPMTVHQLTGEPRIEWNDAQLAKLRKLWDDGLSSAKIGKAMNISKNAVVGKAHRIGLAARKSPIRRLAPGETPAPKFIKRAGASTLPALACVVEPTPPPLPLLMPKRHEPSAKPCCWPIGEPGKPSFHFCNGKAENGKPYCADHAAIAYVRVKDRREDVA